MAHVNGVINISARTGKRDDLHARAVPALQITSKALLSGRMISVAVVHTESSGDVAFVFRGAARGARILINT